MKTVRSILSFLFCLPLGLYALSNVIAGILFWYAGYGLLGLLVALISMPISVPLALFVTYTHAGWPDFWIWFAWLAVLSFLAWVGVLISSKD